MVIDGWTDDLAPPGVAVRSVRTLVGGFANNTWQVTFADGTTAVVKSSAAPDAGLFAEEAAGLEVLRGRGGLRTPAVIAVGPRSLTLEALNPVVPATPAFWEAAGRAVAALHGHTSPRHGWDHDGWLGRLPQENAWDEDGHRFFATRRILRYLREPATRRALDAGDLQRVECLCDRLDQLLPAAPAVLTHGDLWRANLIATADGEPAFIDPAVSWTWAEVDLSMMFCAGGVPERFFAAYHELRPPEPGWRERMGLLYLRELLSVVAHFGPMGDYVAQIREVLRRFAPR
ncbi:aminoglycoside phosphotransferase [Kribbella flavida DSM 17836]|uniref:Aminoglycoside phosphotransferase n=1 Tax=Kribbella flavida (strain DSM 17836 / JCM 10339 / NBRC 14399) TaxID=479435 RepID=D2PQ49_KRIFD|nr:fructosamine kinase family protein [Kribbella flavida]ADB34751.1 aminoglycoside phosphotransferase [Kribbella flavida DSM 17836]